MCGILAVLNAPRGQEDLVKHHLSMLNHRGPDAFGVKHIVDTWGNTYIGHTRLSIMDPESGAQPFETDNGTILAVNGEIYNCGVINSQHTGELKTKSDCECIAHIYDKFPDNFQDVCKMLDGVYAFVLGNQSNNNFYAARDPLGVIPLYYGYKRGGTMAFASEMKALNGLVDTVSEFPPGHYYNSMTDTFHKFYEPSWKISPTMENVAGLGHWYINWDDPQDTAKIQVNIHNRLDDAVKKRMMSDVPWGVLLSGGLDSSIIAALASREQHQCDYMPMINTFSIGLEGSPDLAAAELVAKHIKTNHRSYTFTIAEAIAAIPEVIRHLETYDVTTIRAGVPMYLLARHIKATGVKMVLSGEGADEIYGGYLYFKNAPNADEFYHETQRKIFDLHYYDCLRANKAMAAWGVECRVPFLDTEHLEYAMGIHPGLKIPCEDRMEKAILRKSFAHLLPSEICWRQKEQFSDGVGYNWIDSLKKETKNMMNWKLWSRRSKMFPMHTPKTHEALYYRLIFEKYFTMPGASLLVPYGKTCACSSDTAARWAGNETDDASGRSVKTHIKSVVE